MNTYNLTLFSCHPSCQARPTTLLEATKRYFRARAKLIRSATSLQSHDKELQQFSATEFSPLQPPTARYSPEPPSVLSFKPRLHGGGSPLPAPETLTLIGVMVGISIASGPFAGCWQQHAAHYLVERVNSVSFRAHQDQDVNCSYSCSSKASLRAEKRWGGGQECCGSISHGCSCTLRRTLPSVRTAASLATGLAVRETAQRSSSGRYEESSWPAMEVERMRSRSSLHRCEEGEDAEALAGGVDESRTARHRSAVFFSEAEPSCRGDEEEAAVGSTQGGGQNRGKVWRLRRRTSATSEREFEPAKDEGWQRLNGAKGGSISKDSAAVKWSGRRSSASGAMEMSIVEKEGHWNSRSSDGAQLVKEVHSSVQGLSNTGKSAGAVGEAAEAPMADRGSLSPAASRLLTRLTSGTESVEALLEAEGEALSSAEIGHLLRILSRNSKGTWQLALQVFNWGKKTGVGIDEENTATLLKILGQTSLSKAEEVFSSLQAEGYTPGVYAYTSMIRAHARAGQYRKALAVFNLLQERGIQPTLVTYNIVLKVYGQLGNSWPQISALLAEIKARGLKPDVYTYNTVIGACARGRLCDEAEAALEEMRMLEDGMQPDIVTYNALLECYGKAGRLDDARQVLNRMVDAGLQPNTLTLNQLIKAYSCQGQFEEAWGFYEQMHQQGLSPDVFTYSTLLVACGRAGQVAKAANMYKSMKQSNCKPNLYVYNALIDLYGKRGKLKEMASVFQDLQKSGFTPDIVTFNSLLHAYGHEGDYEDLWRTLGHMQRAQCPFTQWTYNILIDAYGRCGMPVEAKGVFHQMLKAGYAPCSATFTSLLAVYGREGEWEEAEAAIRQMRQAGVTPGEEAHACRLHAYANSGRADLLRHAERQLRASGQLPSDSHVLHQALVLAYCRIGDAELAERAFEELVQQGHSPELEVFNALLFMYGKTGRSEHVQRMFERIEAADLSPDTVTYNCLIGLYGRQGLYNEAEKVLRVMETAGVPPNHVTFNSLIFAFCKHGHIQEAVRIFYEMRAAGVRATEFTLSTFISYCTSGSSQEALRVIDFLQSEGFRLSEPLKKRRSVAQLEFEEQMLKGSWRRNASDLRPRLIQDTTTHFRG